MADLISASAVEIAAFFSPVRLAVEDELELTQFLRRFGFALPDGRVNAIVGNLAPLRDGIVALFEAAENASEGEVDADAILELITAARPLFSSLRSLDSQISSLAGSLPTGPLLQPFSEALAAFPEELFDLLLADYLTGRAAVLLHVLILAGVYQVEEIPAEGHARSRGLSYAHHSFDWARWGQLFEHPAEWARDVYAWGVDFDSDRFIGRLSSLFEDLGGTVFLDEMPPAAVEVFVPDWPRPTLPPVMALAPVIRNEVLTQDGSLDAAASGEAGVALFPVSGSTEATRVTDKGLAFGPYLDGEAGAQKDFGAGLSVKAHGSLGAVGGVVFALRPSGAQVATGLDATAVSGSFAFEATLAPQGGVSLLGSKEGTRVEAGSMTFSLGGEASNAGIDFFAAAGVRALKAVIDPGDDGLLSAVLSEPIVIEAGDLLIGYRHGRGLYFEGGSNLAVTIPLHLRLGPLNLTELAVIVDFRTSPSLTLAVTGDLTIGPIFAYADGIGLKTTLVPDPDGLLGNYDLRFGFKPPEAYAIALLAGPIQGGGFLEIGDHEYRGALSLKFETIGFSAFAILNTRLPNGQPGFSFAGSIFGEFTAPLGYGFFLTGLGGVIGINRSVNTDALREVLFAGRLDNLLFPADPIVNAATILDDMAAILPVSPGRHVIGPVARIGWGTPILIEIKLGVALEFGAELRAVVLGGVGINLPTKDAALVSLNLSFFGVIDFAAGTISFDATLTGSRVLSWPIDGDAAFRTGWAPRLDHIASIGGLHPDYPRPANFPNLRRASINFGTNNPKITMSAYAAMTLNSLQFGASASLYAKGPDLWIVGQVAAEGDVYFDALVYFNPFSFDARLGGSLSLLRNGSRAAGLGFDLRLRGPNTYQISGKVWVTVLGIDVDFSINHTWGESQSLPVQTASAVEVLRAALIDNPRFEPVHVASRTAGVTLRSSDETKQAVNPIGGVRFVQRALPLDVEIDKIGEAKITGPKRVDLRVFQGSDPIDLAPASLDFVRGHFLALSEAERLRAPDFAAFKAGFEISGDRLVVHEPSAITESYDYEILFIQPEPDRTEPAPIGPAVTLTSAVAARWSSVNQRAVALTEDSRADATRAAPPVLVRDVGYVAQTGAAAAVAAGTPAERKQRLAEAQTTFSGARGDRGVEAAEREANGAIASYVISAQL